MQRSTIHWTQSKGKRARQRLVRKQKKSPGADNAMKKLSPSAAEGIFVHLDTLFLDPDDGGKSIWISQLRALWSLGLGLGLGNKQRNKRERRKTIVRSSIVHFLSTPHHDLIGRETKRGRTDIDNQIWLRSKKTLNLVLCLATPSLFDH